MEFSIHQKTEKKRRFSFWSHFKALSGKNKSTEAPVDGDVTLLAASKLPGSFRRNTTRNSVLQPTQLERIPENYVTLDDTELQNVHKDAGILFLTDNNHLKWKNPEDHQKHVQFVPTPLNKYHTYSTSDRKNLKINPGKENSCRVHVKSVFPSTSKYVENLKKSGVDVRVCCDKQRFQEINDSNREEHIKIYMPRTSTKSVLASEELVLPHCNESSIYHENRNASNLTKSNSLRRSNQKHVDRSAFSLCSHENIIDCNQPCNKNTGETSKDSTRSVENVKNYCDGPQMSTKAYIETSQRNSYSFDAFDYDARLQWQHTADDLDFQENVKPFLNKDSFSHSVPKTIPYFTFVNPGKCKTLPPNNHINSRRRSIHQDHMQRLEDTEKFQFEIDPQSMSSMYNHNVAHQHIQPDCATFKPMATSSRQILVEKPTIANREMDCCERNMIPPFVSLPRSNELINSQPFINTFENGKKISYRRSYDNKSVTYANENNFAISNNLRVSKNLTRHKKPEKSLKSSSPKLPHLKSCLRSSKSKYDGISSMADDECSLNCSCLNCTIDLKYHSKEIRRSWRRDHSKTKLFFPNNRDENQWPHAGNQRFLFTNSVTVPDSKAFPSEPAKEWYKCNDIMCKSPECDKIAGNLSKSSKPENIYANGDVMISEDYEVVKTDRFKSETIVFTEENKPHASLGEATKPGDKQDNDICLSQTASELNENVTDSSEMTPRSKKISQSCISALQLTLKNLLQEYKDQPKPSFSISSFNSESESCEKLNTIVIKIQNNKNALKETAYDEKARLPLASESACWSSKFLNEDQKPNLSSSFGLSQSLPELFKVIDEQKETPIRVFNSNEALSPTKDSTLPIYSCDTNQLNKGLTVNEDLTECSDELPSGWDKSHSAEETHSECSTHGSTVSSLKNSNASLSIKELALVQDVIRAGMGLQASGSKRKVSITPKFNKRKKFKAKEVLSGKAKVKLGVYHNSGLVTVHVVKAVKLTSVRTLQLNPYIKVSMHPDDTRRAHWRSKVIKCQNNPVFNEKFSFEIVPEDSKKRLIFSLWHRDLEKKRSEFLGCMSFGVHHVMDSAQPLNGWYRLLKEAVGTKKHFAARNGNGNVFTKFLTG